MDAILGRGRSSEAVLASTPVVAIVLVVAAVLAGTVAVVPGYLTSGTGPRVAMVATGVITLGLAALLWWRGATGLTLLLLLVWTDGAIVASSRFATDTGSAMCLALMGLPALATALFAGRPLLVAQCIAGAVGVTYILWGMQGWTATLALHAAVFTVAAGGPAVAVLLLRERLEEQAAAARRQAVTDHLTGVANRRGLEEAVPALRALAAERDLPVGVVVLDVDHFKKVNDSHGHAIGDSVLRTVATTLVASACQDCLVARLGGEEFAVVTLHDPLDLAALAEGLRGQVARAGSAFGVTVSVGAAWDPEGLATDQAVERMWYLVGRADELMYAAKREGRDRVRVAGA